MAGSSPAPRRSHQYSSPQRSQVLSELLDDNRNSEARHRNLIEAAKKEHDRVREEAERVILQHQKKEERQRLLEEKKKEETRIQLEEQIATERLKLLALKEKKVEIPPPPRAEEAKAKDAASEAPAKSKPPVGQQTSTAQQNGVAQTSTQSAFGGLKPESQPNTQPSTSGLLAGTKAAVQTTATTTTTTTTTSAPAVKQETPRNNPFGISSLLNGSNGLAPPPQSTPAPTPAPAAPAPSAPPTQPTVDRYTVIHRNLKALRKNLAEQVKVNHALKSRMGDMRREIRKTVGQFTAGAAGVNRVQQQKIAALLREALANQMQSPLIDTGMFTLEPRNPVQGALHNDAQMPSIFIYLLNIFAKYSINQFLGETSARSEAADPIGVCIAATFSEPDFQWRGASLIDILMAKFRIVCPVLFGYRGNESTEQGRQRLGWWKSDGKWVDQQTHFNRMEGLGAGFAAVALRKFATSKKENPYPPRHYWTAMAKIVNTPTAEISDTQCLVLKAMIQNYEQKFIEFYGTASLAALRTCLIEFPARIAKKSAAVESLVVVAQLLKKDSGLVLG